MSTLYEMTEQASQLYEMLQSDEIDTQTFEDTLEAIGVDEKLETYAKIIRQMEADAANFKTEKDRLAARQKTAENAVEQMKKRVIDFMTASGQKDAKAGVFAFKLSESKSVRVDDEDKIDKKYLIPQPAKVDKAEIRRAMSAGIEVLGCSWDVKTGVRIR